MVLLDGLVSAADEVVVSEWRVPSQSPWVNDGILNRVAFIEVAAQTAAAGAAYVSGCAGAGLLGAVKDYIVHKDARVGERLVCKIEVRLRFEHLVRVTFRIERPAPDTSSALLAEGSLTLALGMSGSEATR